MKTHLFHALALLAVLCCALSPASAGEKWKPWRVLLVIGDQWKDPRSFVVNDGGEFQQTVTLLKSWGVPFDILRLDQQRLDQNRFIDSQGRARYGAILWEAGFEEAFASRDLSALTQAVQERGISMIALGNHLRPAAVQRILGLRFLAEHTHSSPIVASSSGSFLMREATGDLFAGGPDLHIRSRVQVALEGAEVLATQGGMPQITERVVRPDTRAIWIGGDIRNMLEVPAFRRLLRRALTEAVGYALVRTWEKTVILTIDDPGNAQNAWLEHWHYPTLTAAEIRKYLIAPLRAHRAVLTFNIVPGFVDDERHRVEPAWKQRFVDRFGTTQDYISTKLGLDEGVAAGVFEVHSHGWTHMQSDLDSAPGPWWGSDLDGERAEVGWYREFFDVRRNREIPSTEQRYRMDRSREWIREQFGFLPLGFATGGNGVSTSLDHNTWRIAAEAGFGYYGGYLGPDLAVQGRANATADFGGSEDVPLLLPAPPDGHDRGITRRPESFAAVFDQYPGFVFTGLDEYIGYLHAQVRTEGAGLRLEYDAHYGRALIARGSEWKLHLADWMREQAHPAEIRVNDAVVARTPGEWTTLSFAPGRGVNVVTFR